MKFIVDHQLARWFLGKGHHARGDGPTIVWLRIGNAATSELLVWLEGRWAKIVTALEQGRSVIEVR